MITNESGLLKGFGRKLVLFLFSDSNAVTSPKIKSPGLAGQSQIPRIPGRSLMRETGTKHAASMPCTSTQPLGRSPPVSPRSMQSGNAHHGPGMAGDNLVTSPKGYKMMRSGSDGVRGKTRK